MAVEIERKFLVVNEQWRTSADDGVRYLQGYLATTQSCSIRARVGGDKAWLNIKGATVGASRLEFEYAVPVADAEAILANLCATSVEKTRYRVFHAEHLWEVDVFAGENAGLVVAEIELKSEDERFARPPWIGADVTAERRYYNACLAEQPFSGWSR